MSNLFLYILTVVIWGTTWYVIKFQLGVVPADVSVAYRFILAGLIMLSYCIVRGLKLGFSIKDHGFFLIQGLFLFCLNYILFYQSTFVLTTGLIAVVFTSMLIFNNINSVVFFKTQISFSTILAALLGIFGIGLIFWPELDKLNFDQATLYALFLAVAGTFSASLGNMASMRNQQHKIPVIQANTWSMLYGGGLTSLYAFASGVTFSFDSSFSYVGSLIYLSLFGSVIAFWSYLTLLGRIGAGKVAYTTVLFPIVALLISTVFESYQWSLMAFAGVLLSLVGNILMLKKYDT